MLLKRLINICIFHRKCIPNRWFSKPTKAPQPKLNKQKLIQNIEQQIKNDENEEIKELNQQNENEYQNITDKKTEQQEYSFNDKQNNFADIFLDKDKTFNKLFNLNQICQQFNSNQNGKQKIQQYIQKINKQIQEPLKNYQKTLLLSPNQIVHDFFDQHQNQQYSLYEQQEQFKHLYQQNIQKIKKLYSDNFYRKKINHLFINSIVKQVLTNPQQNFILNIIYEQIAHIYIYNTKPQIRQQNLLKILYNVSTQQYTEVNKLKLYWSIIKINPFKQNQCSSLILKQLIKIKINNQQINKLFKIINYFFMNKSISTLIISKLINKTNSLQVFIDLWIITMVIASKLYCWIQKTDRNIDKINLNDVFSVAMKQKKYHGFFKYQLPQILKNLPTQQIYSAYNKSFQHFSTNPSDTKLLIVQQLQQKYGLCLSRQKKTNLQYHFDKDPKPIQLVFLSTFDTKFNFKQFQLVNNIFQGQYSKVLTYCKQHFGLLINDDLSQYFIQAKNKQYNSANSCALYMLKKIFQQSKLYVEIQNHRLTQQKLQNDGEQQEPTKQVLLPAENQVVQEDNKKKNKKKKKALFSKANTSQFSTNKYLQDEQKKSKEQREAHLKEYLQSIKQLQKTIQAQKQQAKQKQQQLKKQQADNKMAEIITVDLFDFSNCKTVEDVEMYLKNNLHQINQLNFSQILSNYQTIPIVGNITPLIKYLFFYTITNNEIPAGLIIAFNSSLGDVQKNYGEYLKGYVFKFKFPDQFYISLLKDQVQKIKRKNFKKIISHMMLYKKQINNQIISVICDICVKQKSGFTFLQIINLINTKNIVISYQSLLKISYTVLQFNGMINDLMIFLKKYCPKIQVQLNATLFVPYLSKLSRLEEYDELNKFIKDFRNELKPRIYEINPKLTNDKNDMEQKIHNQKQHKRRNKQLYEVVKIISKNLKRNTKIPSFISQIYQVYIQQLSNKLTSQQYGVGLILFGRQNTKYSQLLKQIKQNPQQNTISVMQSAMKSLLLFGRNLKNLVQRILKTTLFQKRFQLTQQHLTNFGNIFLTLDIPTIYRIYLQYILRMQPNVTQQIKILYYKVLNYSSDDSLKGQINGLLDFIFNPKREKQRIQYKHIKQQQQKKAQLLRKIQGVKSSQLLEKADEDQQKLGKTQEQRRSKQKRKYCTYDENGTFVYHSNLTKKMLRKQKLRIFIDIFLNRYTPGGKDNDESIHFGDNNIRQNKSKHRRN